MTQRTSPLQRRTALVLVAATMIGATTLIVHRVRAAGAPAVAPVVTYGGSLTLADGTAVNGTRNIGLALYDAAAAGNRLCDVVSSPLPVTLGRFQITLPNECVAATRATSETWVDVMVDGASVGRSKLGAVPYALEGDHALRAENAVSASTAVSAAVSNAATSISGSLKVLEAASDVTQSSPAISQDLVYDAIQVNLTPGTWLIEGEASIITTDVPDGVALGLYNATIGADIPNSRGGIGTTGVDSGAGASRIQVRALAPLHTSKVLAVAASTTVRLKAFRNGASTLQFGLPSLTAGMTQRNRITAVQLSTATAIQAAP